MTLPGTPEAKREAIRRKNLKQRYGLSLEQYEAMNKAQGGKCAICGQPCRTYEHLSVDHCHATGTIRGLLCRACNVLIGKAEDDPWRLISAANYLYTWRRSANGTIPVRLGGRQPPPGPDEDTLPCAS